MRILLTGSDGFLGGRLLLHLKDSGHKVTSISRRKQSKKDGIVRIDLAGDGAYESFKKLLQHHRPDVIIHTASLQPGRYSKKEFVNSNLLTTATILDAVNDYEPEKLIYTSTISVYKTPAVLPVNEQAQTRQDSPYVITKLAAENLLRTGKSQIQTTILRLPSLYGAGQKDSFIDGLAYIAIKNQPIELYSQGKVLRDALHVSDVVEAIDLCLKKIPKDHGSITMNIGCGSPISTYHYAKALIRALNSHSMIIPVSQDSPHAHDIYADISLAKKLIGFSPMSLTVAMERYADELLEQQ